MICKSVSPSAIKFMFRPNKKTNFSRLTSFLKTISNKRPFQTRSIFLVKYSIVSVADPDPVQDLYHFPGSDQIDTKIRLILASSSF